MLRLVHAREDTGAVFLSFSGLVLVASQRRARGDTALGWGFGIKRTLPLPRYPLHGVRSENRSLVRVHGALGLVVARSGHGHG